MNYWPKRSRLFHISIRYGISIWILESRWMIIEDSDPTQRGWLTGPIKVGEVNVGIKII